MPGRRAVVSEAATGRRRRLGCRGGWGAEEEAGRLQRSGEKSQGCEARSRPWEQDGRKGERQVAAIFSVNLTGLMSHLEEVGMAGEGPPWQSGGNRALRRLKAFTRFLGAARAPEGRGLAEFGP